MADDCRPPPRSGGRHRSKERAELSAFDLIECAPWSYNCYFPMPFKLRVRALLRNDADKNFSDYSYAEWEGLPEWNDKLGYFHATFNRRCFQLTRTSDETLFEAHGTGHLIGRQYSIATGEPIFRRSEAWGCS